jgi:alanine racemase
LTHAVLHLDRLDNNLRVLAECAGHSTLWPVIKANAYGHGIQLVARHLYQRGYKTLCVADVSEAILIEAAGVQATAVLLSPGLPAQSEPIVARGCEPAVSTLEMVDALAQEARRQRRRVAIHVMVDTGMGRDGFQPAILPAVLAHCGKHPEVTVRGLMSHFPCADEADKTPSLASIAQFESLFKVTRDFAIPLRHMANSAAIFDLPAAHYDAVRPGIAMYGLLPSSTIVNPRIRELQPVLEWKSRITVLKEVPAGTGLSYGHSFRTRQASLIATVPVGYGDGLSRNLSGRMEMLVCGIRCPQVARITMDQCLLDVTSLRGKVRLGDEVVIIGRQGDLEITADELAGKLGTINYEIVTAIAQRVPRIGV